MVCFPRSVTVGVLITSRYSLHSALKEFFDPLRTNNPRADFFTVYRKESDEFDREYTRKYDEDLNTSLIFVSFWFPFRGLNAKSEIRRPDCFLPSALRLSSMSNPSSNRIQTI